MKLRNNDTSEIKDIDVEKKTAYDLKPDPKSDYSIMYDRSVLQDSFELSKLPQDVVLDLWKIRESFPKKPDNFLKEGEYQKTLDNSKRNPGIGEAFSKTNDSPSPSVPKVNIVGNFELRELGEDIEIKERVVPDIFESNTHQFATVARMGIEAKGPQEELLYKKTTDWTPKIFQHTNFSIVQKEIQITTLPPYVGSLLTIPLNPREYGDLLSSMYFSCKLIPNVNYTERIGRALFRKVELYLNDTLIDWYDDDWSIIHDELFLSADEMLALDNVVNGTDLVIPMKFFFCKKDNYLPLCALYNQRIYIKIYFNQQSWFTDYPEPLDISNPKIIFDHIFLSPEERTYYMSKKHDIIIQSIYREPPVSFTQGFVNINMSANFKVNMLTWFIRNTNYENGDDYTKRYSYGYVSDLVNSYTNFINWRGQTVNYVPVIDYVNLFLNNINIFAGIKGDLYFTYKQPLEHGLSVPDKTLYTYCFSMDPKNPLKRGEQDFATLASKTTNLTMKFNSSLVPQLVNNYSLYLYYYGYQTLSIENGFGVVRS